MNIIGKKLNQPEFEKYVKEKDFGKIPPSKLVVHHTWRPDIKDWKGEISLYGIKNYYESKGWKAGPHLFIAEDGIWLFTDMYDVGIHAGKGNAGYKWGRLDWYSIGIEVVGDYDTKKWDGHTKSNALFAIKTLRNKLSIPNDNIKFHRDYSTKTCPGAAITKEWLFTELAKLDNKPQSETVAKWAMESWQWFRDNHFADTTRPEETVTAEWTAVMLHKLYKKVKEEKIFNK